MNPILILSLIQTEISNSEINLNCKSHDIFYTHIQYLFAIKHKIILCIRDSSHLVRSISKNIGHACFFFTIRGCGESECANK